MMQLDLPQGSFLFEGALDGQNGPASQAEPEALKRAPAPFSSPAEALSYNVLVAGGRAPAPAWLRTVGSGRLVYCADKGLEYALAAGLKPALVCGDGDSAQEEVWRQALQDYPSQVHPRDKDDTDLQLLLRQLDRRSSIVATGVWGGRFDHLYSNLLTLAAWQKENGPVVLLADDSEIAVLVSPGLQVRFKPAAGVPVISLLPLAENSRVNLKGVKWPLHQALLQRDYPYAVSNELTAPVVEFSYTRGAAALYFKFHVEQLTR